jgi:hypothetical protein
MGKRKWGEKKIYSLHSRERESVPYVGVEEKKKMSQARSLTEEVEQ